MREQTLTTTTADVGITTAATTAIPTTATAATATATAKATTAAARAAERQWQLQASPTAARITYAKDEWLHGCTPTTSLDVWRVSGIIAWKMISQLARTAALSARESTNQGTAAITLLNADFFQPTTTS